MARRLYTLLFCLCMPLVLLRLLLLRLLLLL